MNADTLKEIERQCEIVEQSGFGTVKLDIKNGTIYLIETSCSVLIQKPDKVLDKCLKKA